jgi:hypothetical protein
MADTKERSKTPRKLAPATPRPDTRGATSGNARAEGASEETRRLIAEAAYYKAKQRGFAPGHELEDWIEAESEVMGRVNGGER